VIIVVLLGILIIDLSSLWFQSSKTTVAAIPEPKTIGSSTSVNVKATNPHGVRSVTAWIEQGGARFLVFQQKNPAHYWRWKRDQPPTFVRFDTGTAKEPLKQGRARLVIEAVADDFRSASAKSTYDVTIAP